MLIGIGNIYKKMTFPFPLALRTDCWHGRQDKVNYSLALLLINKEGLVSKDDNNFNDSETRSSIRRLKNFWYFY